MSDQQHPTQHATYHGTTDGDRARPSDSAAAAESARTVGAQLARLREEKGWSIDDVSARLKVAPHKLRELESGDFSHLPDVTFAIGIVRSYAKMLGADPTPLSDALRRSRGSLEPDLSMPASSGAGLPRGSGRVVLSWGSTPRRRPWLWAIALAVVVVAALAVWRTGGDSGAAWLARLRADVPEGARGGSAVAAETPGASDAVASGTTVTTDLSRASTSQEASGSTQTVLPRPASIDQAGSAASSAATTAAALASAPASPAIAANARPADTAPTGASTPALAEGQAAVTLKVSQDSWFGVRQRDGKQVFSGLLRAGEEKTVQGVAPLRVTVGNKAGIDSVQLDGQPVSSSKYVNAAGNVARFNLP
jgi:cytoskeleton protein RodZ